MEHPKSRWNKSQASITICIPFVINAKIMGISTTRI